jgi:14-3-3 protein epsilon
MIENMKLVISFPDALTLDECKLLNIAYKETLSARLASWRIFSSTEQKERSQGNEAQANIIKGNKEDIEREVESLCQDVVDLIDKRLLCHPFTETKVFYHKMYVGIN